MNVTCHPRDCWACSQPTCHVGLDAMALGREVVRRLRPVLWVDAAFDEEGVILDRGSGFASSRAGNWPRRKRPKASTDGALLRLRPRLAAGPVLVGNLARYHER